MTLDRRTAFGLITICVMVIACAWLPMTATAQGFTPSSVYGHVSVDGAPTAGVSVSTSDGQSATTDGSGYYQFGISDGLTYTITASYNGYSTSSTFTASGSRNQVDLNIVTSGETTPTPTPTPTPTVTPTPTPTPSPGGPTMEPSPTNRPTVTPNPSAAAQGSPGTFRFVNDNMHVSNGTIAVAVTRNDGSAGTVTVDYSTRDGTAKAGTHYAPTAGTLTFNDGETIKTLTFTVLKGDADNLTLDITLSNPTGGASISMGNCAITIDSQIQVPTHSYISFEKPSYNAYGYYGNLTLIILREGDINTTATIDYTTVDGTATAYKEYAPVFGTLIFSPGEVTKTIEVTLLDSDTNSTFSCMLENPSSGVTVANTAQVDIYYPQTTVEKLTSVISQARGTVESDNSIPVSEFIDQETAVEMAKNSVAGVAMGTSVALVAIYGLRFLEPAARALTRRLPETLLKMLKAYFDVATGYIKGSFFYFYKKFFTINPVEHTHKVMGISWMEIILAILSILLLGLTFSFAYSPITSGITLETFSQWMVAAGFTVVICDLALRLLSGKYKAIAEFKFWEVGTFTLLLTAFALNYPFSQPGKTVIKEETKDDLRTHGIISLIGPYTALLLTILFLFMKFLSNMPDIIGDFGGYLGFIADKGVWIGMVSCVYGLLPIEPMAGREVFKWSKTVWLMVFIPAVVLFLFISILFQPVPTPEKFFIPQVRALIFGI